MDPTKQGFDVNVGGYNMGGPKGGYYLPIQGQAKVAEFNDDYPAGTHIADVFADQAVMFIRSHREEPFFVHMAYYLIHTPLQAVPEMVDKYGGRRNRWAIYASMVEKMDESIGKILAELDTHKAYATTPWCYSVPIMAHTLISLAKRHTALVKGPTSRAVFESP